MSHAISLLVAFCCRVGSEYVQQFVQFRCLFHQLDAEGFEFVRGRQMRAVASKTNTSLRLLAQVRRTYRCVALGGIAHYDVICRPIFFCVELRALPGRGDWPAARNHQSAPTRPDTSLPHRLPRLGHGHGLRNMLPTYRPHAHRYWIISSIGIAGRYRPATSVLHQPSPSSQASYWRTRLWLGNRSYRAVQCGLGEK